MTATEPFTFPAGVRGAGDGVDGMLTLAEGAQLAELARGRTVLELGAWCGLSTIVLAREAVHVWSVDWHQGDPEMGKTGSLEEWTRNIRRHARACCPITLVVGRFEDVLPRLADSTFGMVYIDGAHDEESVQRDTDHARRIVGLGGVIAWHDADRPEVSRVIEATGLEIHRGPDRLAWIQLPEKPW